MRRLWLEPSTDLAEVAGEIVRCTLDGGIVLVPTETQYGLCCNAENPDSMSMLCRVKRRSFSQPSAVYVRDWQHARELVNWAPDGVERFVSHFWPGALTIVAESSRSSWPGIVSPDGKIGLRCSSHRLLVHVAALSHVYLTATSANIHGEPPSAAPEDLINWLAGTVELFIFDSGVRGNALPSTVISIGQEKPEILREGGIAESVVFGLWEREMSGGK